MFGARARGVALGIGWLLGGLRLRCAGAPGCSAWGVATVVVGGLAKLFAGDTAMWVSERAVQVLGGYGYTTAFPVERFFRDAKITQIYEGTQEVQRIVINRSISPE